MSTYAYMLMHKRHDLRAGTQSHDTYNSAGVLWSMVGRSQDYSHFTARLSCRFERMWSFFVLPSTWQFISRHVRRRHGGMPSNCAGVLLVASASFSVYAYISVCHRWSTHILPWIDVQDANVLQANVLHTMMAPLSTEKYRQTSGDSQVKSTRAIAKDMVKIQLQEYKNSKQLIHNLLM
jgi:hypothetical protein